MHPQKHTGKGGKVVAEYDPLSRKVTQLYSMREMVLPVDELKVFNEPLEVRWRTKTNTIKEMAIAMELETGNRSQYGKIKIISTRK